MLFLQTIHGAQAFLRQLLEEELEEFEFSGLPKAGFHLEFAEDSWDSDFDEGPAPSRFAILAGVSGLRGTINNAGAAFDFILDFTDKTYPSSCPDVHLEGNLRWHVNINKHGRVFSPLLNDGKDWNETVSIKEILLHLQVFMHSQNLYDPACGEVYTTAMKDRGR